MKLSNVKYYIGTILTVCVAYWQLSTFKFATKWDNFSAFFPYKYTASHWWNNGVIPMWDPYQNLGYPMHANPQSGVFYPITWLFGLVKGYGIYSLNLEVLFHFTLAGIGMYLLCIYYKRSKNIAFATGIVYALSGFIFGSSHMLGFTTAAAWLPFCILALDMILKKPSAYSVSFFVVIHYFQLTGAYLAFSIILFYIEIGYIIYYLTQHKFEFKRIAKFVVPALLVLLVSAPFLYSISDSVSYMDRSSGILYGEQTMGGNFSFQCLLSLLAPYINSSSTGFVGVDVSLSNIFIGIPFLIFLIGYILFTKMKGKWLLIGLMVLSLFLALGIHTPVHKIFFQFVPGFNLFRHPYLFSLYFIFLAIILASHFWQSELASRLKETKIISSILGLVLVIGIVISFYKTNFDQFPEYWNALKQNSENSPLNAFGHFGIQAITHLMIISLVLFSLKRKSLYLVLVCIIGMVMSVQFNASKNLYYNIDFNWLNSYVSSHKDLPLTNQKAQEPIRDFLNDSIPGIPGFVVNKNTFSRTIGSEGYNPFVYSSLITLKESGDYDQVLDSGIAYGKDIDISNFTIGFNSFSAKSTAQSESFLSVSQNYHHNWVAYVNDKETKIIKDKNGLMKIPVPKGNSNINLKYRDQSLKLLFFISVSLLIMLSGIVLFRKLLKQKLGPKLEVFT